MSPRGAGPGAALARPLAKGRDAIADALLRAGVAPDAVSWAGFAAALVAAACLLAGASHLAPWSPVAADGASRSLWPAAAFGALVVSGFLDVVDGAMARRGGRVTAFGGVLDSTIDRLSDLAVHLALVLHFAARGHLTFTALAMLAFAHGVLIAYLRSRAEVVVAHAAVGFWQRSERCVLLGFGAFWGHVPAALWILGTLPALTCWRRWRHVRALLAGVDAACADAPAAGLPSWMLPWRAPRGSWSWGLPAAAVLAFVLLAPAVVPWAGVGRDPLAGLSAYVSRG